jgi:hypothetical protein
LAVWNFVGLAAENAVVDPNAALRLVDSRISGRELQLTRLANAELSTSGNPAKRCKAVVGCSSGDNGKRPCDPTLWGADQLACAEPYIQQRFGATF